MEYENKEICAACGGICCKKSGCDYFTTDFEIINKNSMLEVLETGNVSIVSAFIFDTLANGQKKLTPFLYLRARNKNRGIVDLFSMKTQCSMLTESGCSYDLEHRPGGGVNLIPGKEVCTHLRDPRNEMLKWKQYQGLLSKLVKRYTGKTVNTVIKENVEEVFYQILTEQFDGVQKEEIKDIKSCIFDLAECFPEEYVCAKRRKEKNIKILNKKLG